MLGIFSYVDDTVIVSCNNLKVFYMLLLLFIFRIKIIITVDFGML